MNVKSYIHEFGVGIFASKLIRKPFYGKNTKLSRRVCITNENIIKRFLKNNIDLANNEIRLNHKNIEYNAIIWTMWWQGLENAPLIVRKCIENQKKNNPNHKIIVITEKNYGDYVDLPEYIIKKFREGKISVTHFSDIIRVNLLYQYGGIWVDSTLLMTKSLPQEWFNKEFYTINTGLYTDDPSHGRWTTFFIEARRGSELMKFLANGFNKYLSKYNYFIDYILFDYLIEIGYENSRDIREVIDAVPRNNQNVFLLRNLLLKPVNGLNYKDSKTFLYKLSYKDNLKTTTKEGQLTIYGEIVKD